MLPFRFAGGSLVLLEMREAVKAVTRRACTSQPHRVMGSGCTEASAEWEVYACDSAGSTV